MEKKLTTYQMAVTALMAAVMCVLGPLTVPIGAVPISLANFVICLTAWLLGPKFGTLSVAVYLCIGLIGVPVFSGYGAGLAKLAGPTGGYLVGYLLLALIGGLFIEKSKGNPVVSGIGLVLGDAACYVLGTIWFMILTGADLVSALGWCVLPYLPGDAVKIALAAVLNDSCIHILTGIVAEVNLYLVPTADFSNDSNIFGENLTEIFRNFVTV